MEKRAIQMQPMRRLLLPMLATVAMDTARVLCRVDTPRFFSRCGRLWWCIWGLRSGGMSQTCFFLGRKALSSSFLRASAL